MKKPESCTAHAMRTTTRKCKEAALNLLTKKQIQSLNCTLPASSLDEYSVGKRTRAASSKSSSLFSCDDDTLTSASCLNSMSSYNKRPLGSIQPLSPADTGDENSQPATTTLDRRAPRRRRTIHRPGRLEHQMVNHHDESSNTSSSVSSYMTTPSSSDISSHLPHFNLTNHLKPPPKPPVVVKPKEEQSSSSSSIPVPGWRVKPISVGFRLEGTENTGDEVYAKRHQRHETDEIKIKRRDMRRQYENYLREKMMLKEGRKVVTQSSHVKNLSVASIPNDGHIYTLSYDLGKELDDIELESILIVEQKDLVKARVAPKPGEPVVVEALVKLSNKKPVDEKPAVLKSLNLNSKSRSCRRRASVSNTAHNNKENSSSSQQVHNKTICVTSSSTNNNNSIFNTTKRNTPTSVSSKKRLISSIYDDIDSDYNASTTFDFALNTSHNSSSSSSKAVKVTTISPPLRRRSTCSQITNSFFAQNNNKSKTISSPVRKRQRLT